MKNIRLYYTIAFSALVASIPFTDHFQAVPNILMAVTGLLFFFTVKKNDFNALKNTASYSYLGLLVVVVLGIMIYSRSEDWKFLNTLLLIPAVVILSLSVRNIKIPIYSFLGSSAVLMIVSAVNLLFHFISTKSLKIDVGEGVNNLLLGERPFLGFIYLVSFCLSLWFSRQMKGLWRYLFIIFALLFAVYILFISARLSLLSLVLILIASSFYTQRKKLFFFGSIAIVGMIASVALLNPTFVKRFTAGFDSKENNIENILRYEPRYHIWSCASDIGLIKEVPVLGYGFRSTVNRLTDCYTRHDHFFDEEHREYFVNSRFNTHNQFLNFYLSTGLIGLILYLLFFVGLFKLNFRQFIPFALVLAMFMFCIFENVLTRQIGAMLFGVVISFLIFFNRETERE